VARAETERDGGRELRRTLRLIEELGRAAQGRQSVSKLMRRLCERLAAGFGFERVAVALYLAERDEMTPLAAYGISDQDARRFPPSLDRWPLLREALAGERIVAHADVRPLVPAEVAEHFGVRAMLVAPLVSAGRPLGFLVADRRGAPIALDRTAMDLLRVISVLTATLVEKELESEELRRLEQLKSSFVAVASHELRTPFATIYGAIMTLRKNRSRLSPVDVEALFTGLFAAAERMRVLIEQLLDVAVLEAGAADLRVERMPLRGLVQEVLASLGPTGPGVDLDVPDVSVDVDRVAFERVVGNLVANAFRYGAPPVRISAEADALRLVVAVEDRGRGVDLEFVPHLFDRFTRSGAAASAESPGSGLGLAIAKTYAEALGGSLAYEPVKPTGARFLFVLPAARH
jgi:signal transduction histidine kinase